MAKTTSLSFPNMFNVAQNKVDVLKDENAVANRCRLLLLTDRTEVYNAPTQGCGLKEWLFQYNNDNTYEMMKDRIREQLREFEPQCHADRTEFTPDRVFTGDSSESPEINMQKLDMTVAVKTVFGKTASVRL